MWCFSSKCAVFDKGDQMHPMASLMNSPATGYISETSLSPHLDHILGFFINQCTAFSFVCNSSLSWQETHFCNKQTRTCLHWPVIYLNFWIPKRKIWEYFTFHLTAYHNITNPKSRPICYCIFTWQRIALPQIYQTDCFPMTRFISHFAGWFWKWPVCLNLNSSSYTVDINLPVYLYVYGLTHRGRVTHISKHHLWFRWWFVAWSAASHYLNQCCNIVNWTLRNKFQWHINRNSRKYLRKCRLQYDVYFVSASMSKCDML